MKENKKPILSICIPTYNRWYSLQYVLKSIIDQDEFKSGDVEIVISDNASTDETEVEVGKLCKKYGNIRYFRNKENIGAMPNINKVMELGIGDYLWPLSSHMMIKIKVLEQILFSIKLLKPGIVLLPSRSGFNVKKSKGFYDKENFCYFKTKKKFFEYVGEQYKYDYNSFYFLESTISNSSCLIINKDYYRKQKEALIKKEGKSIYNSHNFIFYLIAYYNSYDTNLIIHYNSFLSYLGNIKSFKKFEKKTGWNRMNPIYKKHAQHLINYISENYNSSKEFLKFKKKFNYFWLYIFISPIIPDSVSNFIFGALKNIVKKFLKAS